MNFLKENKETLLTLLKGAVTVVIFISGALMVWASTFNIPDLQSFNERVVSQSTKIFDRTGEVLLHEVHGDVQRTVVPYEKISRNMVDATLAIEDAEFYEHHGIDPSAILRATWINLTNLEFTQGGSTITQQVVKNSLLTSEKTISRKIKEWILALRLEQEIGKDRILELYLNEVPYGGNLYGVEEASQYYFDTSAEKLSIAQSAYLAALPKAPTYYSPYGNNRDALEQRKNNVLEAMFENDFITQKEYNKAKDKQVEFITHDEQGIKAPHFVFYILEKLENRFGPETLKQQGLRVRTALNWDYQKKAQKIVTEHAKENTDDFNARNAGMVATDPQTGEILTMVGSRDYFDEEIDGSFNVTLAERQPGSAFKPFVYASALNDGYTPQTVVFDLKTQFSTACDPSNLSSDGECYSPVNYDGKFRGPVTFKEALAQSINIPAVKALYLTGTDDAFSVAERMGIRSLENPQRYGLTLVLGGGEVTLLNMTSAYGVFANEGKRVNKQSILSIEDNEGNVIQNAASSTPSPVQVIPEDTANKISDILSDNQARAPAFGQNSDLHFPTRDVAAKTGTTNNYRDAWILGYTPNIAVGAWAGNNNNESMRKEIAGFIVAPMWNEFMQEVLASTTPATFPAVEEPSPDTKPILRGIWKGGRSEILESDDGETEEEISGGVHSILHWVDKNDPRGPIPETPENDRQYPRWERQVQQWVDKQDIENDDFTREVDTNTSTSSNQSRVAISGIENEYEYGETVSFDAGSTNDIELESVDIYLNDNQIGTTSSENGSLSYSFSLQNIDKDEQTHDLRLEFTDENGNTFSLEETIRLE